MTAAEEDRLVKLEMLAMHLQHDVEQLNAAVLAQGKELREARAGLARLQRVIDAFQQPAEPRDPLSEVPPHH